MKYHVEQKQDILIFHCGERMDINASLEMEEEIVEKIDEGFRLFVFDLSNTQYISSSGIRVLVSTLKKLEKKDGFMVLTNITSAVNTILNLVELKDLFVIRDSLEEAMNYLNEKAK